MKFLIILFIVGFIGISLFGFTGMSGNAGHSQCLAVVASGGIACLDMNGLMGMVSVHFGAFQKFSNAVFGENFLIPLLVLIGIISLVIFQKNKSSFIAGNSTETFYKNREEKFLSLPLKLEINGWLSLCEKSPALI